MAYLSYHGHTIDILKSSLQKYIRRGDFNKAIYAALELDIFKYFPDKPDPNSTKFQRRPISIRTNLIHRLMIILIEDLGTAENNIERWLYLHSLFKELLSIKEICYDEFYQNKRNIESLEILESDKINDHSRNNSNFSIHDFNLDKLAKSITVINSINNIPINNIFQHSLSFPLSPSGAKEIELLINIIFHFCSAPKNREIEHLILLAKYITGEITLKIHYDQINPYLNHSYLNQTFPQFAYLQSLYQTYYFSNYFAQAMNINLLTDKFLELQNALLYILLTKQIYPVYYLAYVYAYKLLTCFEKENIYINVNGKRKPIYYIVYLLKEVARVKRIKNFHYLEDLVLTWIGELNSELTLVYFMLIHVILSKKEINMLNFSYQKEIDLNKIFAYHLNLGKVEIDDYCLDMHTYLGKLNGKNIIDFVKEGSIVRNEDKGTDMSLKMFYNYVLLNS